MTALDDAPPAPSLNQSTLRRYEAFLNNLSSVYCGYAIVFLVIACVVLPHFLIFSTDDLAVAIQPRPLHTLAITQAANGRYAFWAILRLLDLAGVGYGAFLGLSAAFFIAAILFLIGETFALAGITWVVARLFGALIYITYCFNMDIYQFKTAYLSYALSFGLLGLAVRVGRSSLAALPRITIATVCLIGSIGAYQTSLQFLVMMLGVWALALLTRDPPDRSGRGAWVLIPALALAMVGYGLCNILLKRAGIDGFDAYPSRPQGAVFIVTNLLPYFSAILDIFNPLSRVFAPLTNPVIGLVQVALLAVSAWLMSCAARSFMQRLLIWGIFAGCILCAPNPANLMMALFWPSARSMTGIAIFYAGLVALLIERWPATGRPAGAGSAALVALVLSAVLLHGANDAYLIGRRFFQQQVDFAQAEKIVADVANALPEAETPLTARIVIAWHSNLIYRDTPYDYGLSLFGAPWSATALLTFTSGGAVVGEAGSRSACPATDRALFPTTTRLSDRVALVCFPDRRVGPGIPD
nr:hypothetical protein [uncultured Rhodopila sp.]